MTLVGPSTTDQHNSISLDQAINLTEILTSAGVSAANDDASPGTRKLLTDFKSQASIATCATWF